MLTVTVPFALGTGGIVLIVLAVIVLAALAFWVLANDPRQVEVEAERDEVVEQIGLHEPIDFEADLRPPREP